MPPCRHALRKKATHSPAQDRPGLSAAQCGAQYRWLDWRVAGLECARAPRAVSSELARFARYPVRHPVSADDAAADALFCRPGQLNSASPATSHRLDWPAGPGASIVASLHRCVLDADAGLGLCRAACAAVTQGQVGRRSSSGALTSGSPFTQCRRHTAKSARMTDADVGGPSTTLGSIAGRRFADGLEAAVTFGLARKMGGANGSRECAPDDKLRDTHHCSRQRRWVSRRDQPILRSIARPPTRTMEPLSIQLIGHFVDPGLDAGLVLFAAWRA